jgi:FkbM family methyltransferase
VSEIPSPQGRGSEETIGIPEAPENAMNIDEAIHLAIEHYHSGNLAQSETICRELLAVQPDNAQVLHLLGVISYVLKKYDSAIHYFKESLSFDPSDAEAYYNCGNAFKDQEQFDEAAAWYKKALQFDPRNPYIYLNLGYVLGKKGELDEAVQCYREAIRLEPDNAMAHFNLGNALFDKGLFDAAIEQYQKTIAIDPDHADAYHYLGGIFQDKGLFDEAIEYYQKALAIDPDNADAYNCLGGIYQDQGQLDQAVRYYERAVRIDPNLIIYNNLFLAESKGVIHVGANLGQERELYAAYGLNVIWIEPIPEVCNELKTLIHSYPRQKAFCYLVTDVDGREYLFHVSNKGGGASSIYDLAGHKELWPDVTYTETISLNSITLSSLMRKERLDVTGYDVLVLDTQGSELLVLKGATSLLPHIRYVRAEVADFEAYAGCCKLDDMDNFFKGYGFRRIATGRFAEKKEVGSYYDVLYGREPGML